MKRILLRALGGLALCWPVFSMSAQTPAPVSAPAEYQFAPADLMPLGVYYYPEAWPAAQWPRDMANIRKLGLEFVHMGEFAWAFMEPSAGKFDFDWLDRAIHLAAEQGQDAERDREEGRLMDRSLKAKLRSAQPR